MIKYNKLVRDKIPEIIFDKGGNPKFHIADEEEYHNKLKDKLVEEVKEWQASEAVEELADILEVIDAICLYKNLSSEKLLAIKEARRSERGGFTRKIILEES